MTLRTLILALIVFGCSTGVRAQYDSTVDPSSNRSRKHYASASYNFTPDSTPNIGMTGKTNHRKQASVNPSKPTNTNPALGANTTKTSKKGHVASEKEYDTGKMGYSASEKGYITGKKEVRTRSEERTNERPVISQKKQAQTRSKGNHIAGRTDLSSQLPENP